jgi:Niemann-Pick C1 protein
LERSAAPVWRAVQGPEEHIPARKDVTALLEEVGAPYKFSHIYIYSIWETDEIIGFEFIRNIGLVMAGVFLVTLVLLANLQMCVYILVILIITLTDIVGFLHFWDTNIDVVSYFNIFLAIGLVIDYSVHIGLAFMVAKGSRKDKAEKAVATIGPAVLNGGITTFLALLLCSLSTSHVFLTFFKVFMLTVSMGLFHGLVLFPVLLSLVGPIPALETTEAASVSVTIGTGATNIAFTKEV